MIAYHLDLKVVLFRREWLRELFGELARLGFTHVCFEIEDSVRLDCLPGVGKIDSYSNEEFAGILSDCRAAGLEAFPLVQIMGHLEFLLHHGPYQRLRDNPGALAELAASSAEGGNLIAALVDETFELFGRPALFHLGADEVRSITLPPDSQRTITEVYAEHVSRFIRQVAALGARPMIWADIVLAHPESVEMLPRDVIFCDWDYWTAEDPSESILAWGCDPCRITRETADQLPAHFAERFRPFYEGADGRVFKAWFYTDYLRARGFEVVVCPALRCSGDNYCSPRAVHGYNVVSAAVRHSRGDLAGLLVTDWAVRMNHVATHYPHLALVPPALSTGSDRMSRNEPAAAELLGLSSVDVYRAIELLSDMVPFARERGVLSRSHHVGARGDFFTTIMRLNQAGTLKEETDRVLERGQECKEAGRMLAAVTAGTPAGSDALAHLRLAADMLTQKASQFLIMAELVAGEVPRRKHVLGLLDEIYQLRDRTAELFARSHREASLAREINARFFGEELFLSEFGLRG